MPVPPVNVPPEKVKFPARKTLLLPPVNVPLDNVKFPFISTVLEPALRVPPAMVTLLSMLMVPMVLIVPPVVLSVGDVLPVKVMPLIEMVLVAAPF